MQGEDSFLESEQNAALPLCKHNMILRCKAMNILPSPLSQHVLPLDLLIFAAKFHYTYF